MKICRDCRSSFESSTWRCPVCGAEPPAANGYVQIIDAPEFAPYAFADDDEFEDLALLEPASFWFRTRNDMIAWALGEYFSGARSFFEIGCGTGIVLAALRKAFPDVQLSGGDPHLRSLELARMKEPTAELIQVDACQLPFKEEFDVVGAFDVLEHIGDDLTALRELRRAVRKGGGLLITVPQHPRLWSAADEWARHERRYSRRDLVRRVVEAGFEPVRITSFVSLLLPLMALSRARQRDVRTYDPRKEFLLGPVRESLLYGVARFEHAMIRRKLSFGLGGSLLLIARRPI